MNYFNHDLKHEYYHRLYDLYEYYRHRHTAIDTYLNL